MKLKEFLAILLLFIMIFIGIGAMSATVHGANVDISRDFDNVTIYHAEKSDSSSQAVYGLENNAKLIGRDKIIEVPFYKIIVIPEIIIDNPVIPIQNNTNIDQYNETNTDKVQNNNTTNLNNVTNNINKENNIGTYTSDNIKTVTMEKTGNDTVGIVLLIVLFIILIQLYRKEDEK